MLYIDKIKDTLDSNLTSMGNGFEVVDYIRKNYQTHNHYELVSDFVNTDFFKKIYGQKNFKNLDNEDTKGIQQELRDNLISIINTITDYQSIVDNIPSILTNHANHIITNNPQYYQPFRFNANHWACSSCVLNSMESVFPLIMEIEKYENDTETGGISSESWHKITETMWALVYGGYYTEGMYIVTTLEKLIYKIYNHKPSNVVFPGILDQSSLARFLMSIYFVKAKLHMLRQETEFAIECYEKICAFNISYFKNPSDYSMIIFWFRGITRLTEASIEIYKLNPTQENKNRCIDYFLQTCRFQEFEHTESVREHGHITFSLAKYVLEINIDKL